MFYLRVSLNSLCCFKLLQVAEVDSLEKDSQMDSKNGLFRIRK